MNLAPILIFAYNRPLHLQQTLDALSSNSEAKHSNLYIFCDGAKPNMQELDLKKIESVQIIAKNENRFKTVSVIKRTCNYGLSKSVITGVSEVIKKYKRVIVLEDDIVVSKYFLGFINKGLEVYKNDKKVFGVTGHCFSTNKSITNNTYFLPIMSSWGYATWLDRWDKINFNGYELLKEIDNRQLADEINFGELQYYNMLKNQVAGVNDSWAVRFYVSMFLNKGVFLYPKIPLLSNIGLDGSGIHCLANPHSFTKTGFLPTNKIDLVKEDVVLKPKIIRVVKNENEINKNALMPKIKKLTKKLIAPELIDLVRRKFNKKRGKEISRLLKLSRFTKTKTNILGKTVVVPDGASFVFMYNEIFIEQIYKYTSKKPEQYIIDAGANIGLATIYLKKQFPQAQILAFEPDPEIYKILKKNIESFEFSKVELINKGVWKEDTTLSFFSEGADAGTLNFSNKKNLKNNINQVAVVNLGQYIYKPVDFLKIDIEGAETEVLHAISNKLHFVERIFVEYHSYVNQEQTLNEIINTLKNNGFRLYISAGLASKSPFFNIRTYANMDMQLNIYGIKQ
ncbi:FkbM family methyltransferase [Tamlana sp. 62-3]|uniref:FkbM family methyltransferase n=1 Tax=Neotamlana sargassicola TaxID=2883125 RepID=A0A9X1L508_9FLAO|nr:FkbM family methyltransferase [Tamlana sargassicola]MCB4808732.1 FkbM family methyltransferase [Tamlana sargassicola]